jgi:hypothetical protein
MHPTYTILSQQCYFYARLVYTATKEIFGISPSQSANKSALVTLVFQGDEFSGLLVSMVGSI